MRALNLSTSMTGVLIANMLRSLRASPLVFLSSRHGLSGRNRAAKRSPLPGYVYPHSSDRQRARYARQIAAGQLRLDGVEGS